jgi:hypothetical protein
MRNTGGKNNPESTMDFVIAQNENCVGVWQCKLSKFFGKETLVSALS